LKDAITAAQHRHLEILLNEENLTEDKIIGTSTTLVTKL
jgi:hypothetical protein